MTKSNMIVLAIEDDDVLGKMLLKGLNEHGHTCTWVKNGDLGLKAANESTWDAIVLDLLIPEMDGLSVLRQLRASGNQTPVIILTALGTVEERVQGFDCGADDYLVKPFAFAELIARLHAIGRRSRRQSTTELTCGDLIMELTTRRVTRNAIEIELTRTEFNLLEFLLRNSGQTVTRKMLCEHLWESDWEGVTNVIEVHINRLRNKLNRGFASGLIQTVRGSGYVLRKS